MPTAKEYLNQDTRIPPAPARTQKTPVDLTTLATHGYLGALILLGLFGIHRLSLIWRFRWTRHSARSGAGELPRVTVQLPLFNLSLIHI